MAGSRIVKIAASGLIALCAAFLVAGTAAEAVAGHGKPVADVTVSADSTVTTPASASPLDVTWGP
ncbi:hypothetical protein GXW82_31450 [Streptacidiphilus sp. 4-A2]|nr:hypothetical protein [Streptacidiphilus sp. 4-A2]